MTGRGEEGNGRESGGRGGEEDGRERASTERSHALSRGRRETETSQPIITSLFSLLFLRVIGPAIRACSLFGDISVPKQLPVVLHAPRKMWSKSSTQVSLAFWRPSGLVACVSLPSAQRQLPDRHLNHHDRVYTDCSVIILLSSTGPHCKADRYPVRRGQTCLISILSPRPCG